MGHLLHLLRCPTRASPKSHWAWPGDGITERRSYYGNDACPTEPQYYFYGECGISGAWLTELAAFSTAFQRAVLAG